MKLDYTALRDLIAEHESESSAAKQGVSNGYDVCSWYIPQEDWPQNAYGTHLTEMSVKDVQNWQKAIRKRGVKSSAAGRYQIIHDTLKGLEFFIDGDFSPSAQDVLCDQLLDRRGATKWENGKISDEQFGQNLAMEWAALPIFYPANGNQPRESYYDGDGLNKAGVSCEEVLEALAKVRATGDEPVAPEPPEDDARIVALENRLFDLEALLLANAKAMVALLGDE